MTVRRIGSMCMCMKHVQVRVWRWRSFSGPTRLSVCVGVSVMCATTLRDSDVCVSIAFPGLRIMTKGGNNGGSSLAPVSKQRNYIPIMSRLLLDLITF